MRHIMQGFTMYIGGSDFGIDTEEVELPFPVPVTQEYRGGGMDTAINLPMSAIEALEITVKMSGLNPEIQGRMALAPGTRTRLSFRAGVMRELDGGIAAHVFNVSGQINGASRDRFTRGEKAGLEFVVNGIDYLRYEADSLIIHELGVWPPVRIINGQDQLAELNLALGR